mgnify:CR=1 FL=1
MARKKSEAPLNTQLQAQDLSLALYLKGITKSKPLTSQQEADLTARIRKGDQEALHELVLANLRFVVSVSRNYQNQGLPLTDLINEGNLGLINAARRFDERKNFRFISYAVWWIRQAILQALAENSRIVRLPINRVGSIHKIGMAQRKLEQRLRRTPTTEEIAAEMGVPEKDVHTMLQVGNRHVSFDAPLSNQQSSDLHDVMTAEQDEPVEGRLHQMSVNEEVSEALEKLAKREREVVMYSFGIGTGTALTLEEIGERLGLVDFQRGAKISGSGFIVFRGMGARLVRAMIDFFLDVHVHENGYEEVWVPVVVNRASMIGTSQLPKFEDDMYALRDENLYLVPTAEVPVTNLYRDEILDRASLPKAFASYTPCFRREAGAAGKDTRGLLRVHQFDKVEIVRYCTPEDDALQHELLTRHAEALLERLGIPYRRVLLAAGDLGFGSAKTWDLEAWAPGVGKWLEVSSCSTFTDFQARRANIRYRPEPGAKPQFVHTLNGSALAFPRVIACLLEHYQQEDGSVSVPEVLQPYLRTDVLR